MTNLTHQVKSRFYYLFWGAMAVAVVGSQLYTTTRYDKMTHALEQVFYAIENESVVRASSLSDSGDKLGPGY